MTRTVWFISPWAFLVIGLADVTGQGAPGTTEGRYRVCALTDLGYGRDDEQSLTRFLALVNMYDVEGIVLSPFESRRRHVRGAYDFRSGRQDDPNHLRGIAGQNHARSCHGRR